MNPKQLGVSFVWEKHTCFAMSPDNLQLSGSSCLSVKLSTTLCMHACVCACVWDREKEREWASERAPLPAWFNICQPLSVWSALSYSQDKLPFNILDKKGRVSLSCERECVRVYLYVCVSQKSPMKQNQLLSFILHIFNVFVKGILSFSHTHSNTYRGTNTNRAFIKQWTAHPAFSLCCLFSVTKKKSKIKNFGLFSILSVLPQRRNH